MQISLLTLDIEKKDPVLNPSFASSYTDEDLASNSVIVVSDKRSKVIPYSDLYESSVNYQTYSMETTAFDGEGQVTSAIAYVTTEDLPILYTLTGHEENDLDSSMQSAIEKENIEVQELNLLTAGTVPEDASCLRKDFSDDETSAILTFCQVRSCFSGIRIYHNGNAQLSFYSGTVWRFY